MPDEFARVPRLLPHGKIAGRTNRNQPPVGTDPHCDHILLDALAKADPRIIAFLDDVAETIVEEELDRDIRIVAQDRLQLRPDDAFERFVQGGLTMLQTQFKEAPNDIEELTELARYFVSDLYAFKHPDYRDEREIRVSRLVVRNGNGLTDVGGSTRSGEALAGLPIGYRQSPRGPTAHLALPLYREGKEAIQSIVIGNSSGDAVERIRALAWDGLEIVSDG